MRHFWVYTTAIFVSLLCGIILGCSACHLPTVSHIAMMTAFFLMWVLLVVALVVTWIVSCRHGYDLGVKDADRERLSVPKADAKNKAVWAARRRVAERRAALQRRVKLLGILMLLAVSSFRALGQPPKGKEQERALWRGIDKMHKLYTGPTPGNPCKIREKP